MRIKSMWLNMVDSFVRQNNSNAKNTCNEMRAMIKQFETQLEC